MSVGAEGVISVASNLYVREISQMVRLAQADEFAKAAKLHRRLYPVFKAIFIESNPSPIKFALVKAGIIGQADVRLPLSEISPGSAQMLSKVLGVAAFQIRRSMSVSILINGSRGRMGLAIAAAAAEAGVTVSAALDAGDDLAKNLPACDVVIDFSSHRATHGMLELAVALGKPVVIGTTGHSADEKAQLLKLAERVPCVWAGNFSVGVNLLFALTRRAASVLGSDYDAEVMEMHHRFKKDAPSGTAARLIEIILEERKLDRVGPSPRSRRHNRRAHAHRGWNSCAPRWRCRGRPHCDVCRAGRAESN